MAQTLNLATLASFQAYVLEHGLDFWAKLQYGFKTAGIVAAVEGVKGKHTLPSMTIGSNLSKRWTSTFEGQNNKATPGQRTIETFLNKIEFQFIPTEWEANYLGFLRKRNIQDPYDFPLEAYILMKLIEKHNAEREDAAWQAVQASPIADSDQLDETFDGFLQIIADEITGGLSPVTTGTIDSTNAVAKFRLLWEQLDKAYKEAGEEVLFFCNHSIYDAYRINYKTLFHESPQTAPVIDTSYSGLQFELGAGNAKIVPIPGLGSSNRVILTPPSNLVLGYDGDPSALNFEKNHWTLDMFAAFRMGAQIRTNDETVLVVNDQT